MNRASLQDLLRLFLPSVRRLCPDRAWLAWSVLVTDDAGIRPVHAAWLGKADTTDVITFAYPCPPPDAGLWIGELVVNAACARRRGGTAPARELALYLAHGCDHLAGADDATPVERRRMRARENRWLRADPVRACIGSLLHRT